MSRDECEARSGSIGGVIDDHRFRRIVWPLAVSQTIVWAAMYYVFPALLLEWERDLTWSKAELTGAFTLALVVSAVLGPVAGRLIDRGHGRVLLSGNTLLGGMLLCLLSRVSELWQFYGVWLGLGVAMSGTLYVACFAILTRTMGTHAKRAITFVTLVAGVAGTVAFPSAHALVGLVGWRGTVTVFGLVAILVATPLVWRGCRAAEEHGEASASRPSPRAAGALRVTRSFTFWAMIVAFAALSIDQGMILAHILPLLDDRGIDEGAAVLAASMIGPMQVAGRLAMMAVERHVTSVVMAVGCFLAMMGGAAALLGTAVMPVLLVAFVILHGAGNGVASIMRPVLVAEFLGRKNFGVISGLLAIPYMGGYAAGPALGSLLWNVGGYVLVIWIALGATGLGLVLLLGAARSAGRATEVE